MKNSCERCECKLGETDAAFICTYECTFCESCSQERVCPNCNGELVRRPRRGVVNEAAWVTRVDIDRFNNAWLAADLETLVDCFAIDGVYAASVGPEPGKTFNGADEIRSGIEAMLKYEEDTEAICGPVEIFGNFAVAKWAYEKDFEKVGRLLVKGVDLFEFEGKKISRKDAYIKSIPMNSE